MTGGTQPAFVTVATILISAESGPAIDGYALVNPTSKYLRSPGVPFGLGWVIHKGVRETFGLRSRGRDDAAEGNIGGNHGPRLRPPRVADDPDVARTQRSIGIEEVAPIAVRVGGHPVFDRGHGLVDDARARRHRIPIDARFAVPQLHARVADLPVRLRIVRVGLERGLVHRRHLAAVEARIRFGREDVEAVQLDERIEAARTHPRANATEQEDKLALNGLARIDEHRLSHEGHREGAARRHVDAARRGRIVVARVRVRRAAVCHRFCRAPGRARAASSAARRAPDGRGGAAARRIRRAGGARLTASACGA